MKRILFQGDSITDIRRALDNDMLMGMGYATMVGGELALKNPSKFEFVNRGIAGNRVVDIYARIKKDIINLKPDVMSILIGINDVWHEIGEKNGVDADKYFKIYSMLIEEVKAALPDIKILILEPFVLKGEATEGNWEVFKTETGKRREMAKRVAEKYDLKFVSLQEKFDEVEKLAPAAQWVLDGVHPTYAGHCLIKEEWIKAFYELWEE